MGEIKLNEIKGSGHYRINYILDYGDLQFGGLGTIYIYDNK